MFSGTHEQGSTLRAAARFADDEIICRMDRELSLADLTHEFGDSVFLERQAA
jgi:hypothetical protein